MFRFQRLLSMQSQACQQLSRSILLRTPYQHDPRFERVFSHLDAALDRVQASGTSPEHIKALGFCSTTCGRLMLSWRPLSPNRRWRCRAVRWKISLLMTACTALAICGYG
jgi:uncharacterized membrane protein YccC